MSSKEKAVLLEEGHGETNLMVTMLLWKWTQWRKMGVFSIRCGANLAVSLGESDRAVGGRLYLELSMSRKQGTRRLEGLSPRGWETWGRQDWGEPRAQIFSKKEAEGRWELGRSANRAGSLFLGAGLAFYFSIQTLTLLRSSFCSLFEQQCSSPCSGSAVKRGWGLPCNIWFSGGCHHWS